MLIVPIGVVSIIVIDLIVKAESPDGFRREIKPELLKGAIVHVISVTGIPPEIDQGVVPLRDHREPIRDPIIPLNGCKIIDGAGVKVRGNAGLHKLGD